MRRTETGARPDRHLFIAFLMLLVWVPIPLGSNRAWAWLILELWSWSMVVAWLFLWASGRARLPRVALASWPAIVLLAAWTVQQAAYLLPLPSSLVASLSPHAARVYGLLGDIGSERAFFPLSVDGNASAVSFFKTLAYVTVFFLALVLLNRRSRVSVLAKVLVYSAVALSAYAVLLHVTGVTQHIFGMEIRHVEFASGTYVNRNHFAGYLEMTLALGIGLLIAGLSDRTADSWKKFFAQMIDWVLSPRMILRLALCIVVIALTTTHSRMGNAAFFSSLLLAGGLGIALSRHATRNTVILLASLVAIDLFIVGSWFGVEKLSERIRQTSVEEVEVRETPLTAAPQMIADYPVFGFGPGTFYIAFSKYRPETVTSYYNYAHNDYLQFVTESGIPGSMILAIFVVLSLGAAITAQWRRRDPLMRGMSFACIMGMTSILIHSWVDFNLQIPANATYFMVLCALCWICLNLNRREAKNSTVDEDEEE